MRSREGRLLRSVRAALTAHVGGRPSATQAILIEQVAMLRLQIAMLDAKHIAGGLTPHDQREYLAWTNTASRLMRSLGLKGVAEQKPSLAAFLAQRREEPAA